jgi:CHAD domain-containing protein
LQSDDSAAEVLRELRQVRDRVPHWPLERESIESLAPGFERIYRRGRKAYRRARKEPTTQNLHELSKRSKDLWYAGQIVRPAAPKRLKEISKGAKQLSDLIGEEHDLALLAESADARPDRFGDEASLDELLGVIEQRRKRLRRRSMKVAAELFRKKPRAVARLLEEPAGGS